VSIQISGAISFVFCVLDQNKILNCKIEILFKNENDVGESQSRFTENIKALGSVEDVAELSIADSL